MTRSILFSFLLLFSFVAFGQKNKEKQTKTPVVSAVTTPSFDANLYKGLKWRNIGPFRGGRSNAVSGVTGNDKLYYTGYTGGGLWKTEDAGITWVNTSDGQFNTSSIGDIAVSESNPNIIYVGMGEHAIRGVMTTYGDGVYKSTDAGKTWKHLGLEKTRHISDVIIHPANPDIVYVAAQGAAHGANDERGIYKSIDGGQTWKKTLFVDANSGASSLSMDHHNPLILYAATWEHRRLPWQVRSGGKGCGMWKSADGGDTWQKINEGLPKEMGKIGVSVSRANPDRVYAIVEAEKSVAGLYRSDNAGKSWQLMSNNQLITARSWYYMEVFADPVQADVVYVLNAPMTKSIDGGKTFAPIRVGHGDTHDLWIHPENNQNMILGDDGGGEITYNGGKTWSSLNNQPTAQFYRVNVDQQFPYKVYGGQQDNTSVIISSRNNGIGITDKDWSIGPGCESAFVAFDPKNPKLLYGGCYQGGISVLNIENGHTKEITQYPANILALQPKKMRYRYNWNAPIIASPHDPKVIYHAGQMVFKTQDGGLTWDVVSPDLTRNDTLKQDLGGAPITNEGAGGENYNTISYLIESSLEKGVLYSGSDCGLVHVTRDGGQNWTAITPLGLDECLINSIEVSPHDKGTAYIAATKYKFNDFANMCFKTTDYGKTWTKINQGVRPDDFIRVIREDKKVKNLLYGGAERGFYISSDGGNQWHLFQLNLPVVPVTDIAFADNDLVVSTAGRAFWILDDLSAIQQSALKPDQVKIYTPKSTYKFEAFAPSWMVAPPGTGQNPTAGVLLDYFLPEKADTTVVTLQILDNNDNVIRSFTNIKNKDFKSFPGGPPAPTVITAEKGINRFAWDFKSETLPEIPNAFVYGDYTGYRLAPGTYKGKINYKGMSSQTTFEVVNDPNLKDISKEQWTDQQSFMRDVENKIKEIHNHVNDIRKVRKQIEQYNEQYKSKDDFKSLTEAGKALIEKIDHWEAQLVQTKQNNFQDVINFPSMLNAQYFELKGFVDQHDPRVPQAAKIRMMDINKQWKSYQDYMQDTIGKEIGLYNELYKKSNVPALFFNEKMIKP
ncbi:MAG: glycosyl hydrolase [Saprospiraceae bacterium]|nr:glycosyl hydrolase [Saprospiraceae bacterium]